MEILTFLVTPFATNCYVVKDEGEALVVDPGEATPALLASLDGCTVRAIVNTHGHCDHCGGNGALKEHTGAELLCHEADLLLLRALIQQGQMFGVPFPPSPDPDRFLSEGDQVEVGSLSLEVRHTPGHSPGHVVLVGQDFVLAGDVLFAGSIGRTDLLGGDHDELLASIRTKLLTLPDETTVYSGHGPVTSIGTERVGNPYLTNI